jgi:hypothetical protein
MVNVMRQLKLQLSQVSKSMESHTYNKDMFDLVSSYYNYLCGKESEIERKRLRVEFVNTSSDFQELIYNMAEIENIVEESTELLDESPLGFTIKNLGTILKNMSYDAQKTGNSKAIRSGLLKLVSRCKKEEDARYLLRDSYSANKQLTKLSENKPDIKKECDDHIKWIENEYRPAIQNKLKELKGELKETTELLDEGLKDTIMKTKANITVADRKVSGKIDSIADKIFGTIKSAKDEDERERVIRNSLPKASSIIKKAIVTGLVALINPAIALIGLLASIAINKNTRETQRKLILNELQTEYKIVEEKIKDAESENDKKKKYELMRIQAKLQKDIERIRYNLKY